MLAGRNHTAGLWVLNLTSALRAVSIGVECAHFTPDQPFIPRTADCSDRVRRGTVPIAPFAQKKSPSDSDSVSSEKSSFDAPTLQLLLSSNNDTNPAILKLAHFRNSGARPHPAATRGILVEVAPIFGLGPFSFPQQILMERGPDGTQPRNCAPE